MICLEKKRIRLQERRKPLRLMTLLQRCVVMAHFVFYDPIFPWEVEEEEGEGRKER